MTENSEMTIAKYKLAIERLRPGHTQLCNHRYVYEDEMDCECEYKDKLSAVENAIDDDRLADAREALEIFRKLGDEGQNIRLDTLIRFSNMQYSDE